MLSYRYVYNAVHEYKFYEFFWIAIMLCETRNVKCKKMFPLYGKLHQKQLIIAFLPLFFVEVKEVHDVLILLKCNMS